MDSLSAIHQRFSVRSYTDDPVDPMLLGRLLHFAEGAMTLAAAPPRIALISGQEHVRQVLTFMIGSYGLVQNAPHLLAAIIPEDAESARVQLGYVLEQVVLEATRLGLGTCWITGSYDAKQTEDILGLEGDEVAAAVCALGHPTEEGFGRLHTKLIRRLAGGHKRKPLTKIVFSQHWGEPWLPEAADAALLTVLNHARLAPSAHNGQPWRFVVHPAGILLSVVSPRFIDAGIVMSHFTLAAAAANYEGAWTLCLRDGETAAAHQLPARAIPIGIFRTE